MAALTSSAFLGAEAQILLGMESDENPVRESLRKLGRLIAQGEGDTAT